MDQRKNRAVIRDPGNIYPERYAYPVEFLKDVIPDSPGLIVTIPCFAEDRLIATLDSLKNCIHPGVNVEVIVVINHPEASPEHITALNERTCTEAKNWIAENTLSWLKFHLITAFDLPRKSAGVGLARKIGMDEAARRLSRSGSTRGIISCIDADCRCDNNYFQAVIGHFHTRPECNGAMVYFEHPLEGDLAPEFYEGIQAYELHLRYLTHGLRYAGFPYGFYTVGSTMVVPASVYMRQGGMNTRKAGEDFYFIQKIAALGNFHEIKTTRIIPSPRVSDRVPFGTGKAMKQWIGERLTVFTTYNPLIFKELKSFISFICSAYEEENIDSYLSSIPGPESITGFLKNDPWKEMILDAYHTSSNNAIYQTKLFRWFNGLKIIRYLNFAGLNVYHALPVEEAARWLLENYYHIRTGNTGTKELLLTFRRIDRE